MPVTVRQLAEWVGGRAVGDGDTLIRAARPLGEAGAGDLTFLEDAKHLPRLLACPAAGAVVPPAVAAAGGKALVVTEEPLLAFAEIFRRLHGRPEPARRGIDPSARVHETARVGAGAEFAPFAVVGEGSVVGARCRMGSGAVIGRFCRLGDDVVLHPNAVLYDGTVLGDRVIVHANAVLGADGFGYRFQQGRHVKVPQLGHVEVEDDVEIGAGTTIDRGTFQATRVGAGTKIDNLVMIAHNCRIGRHNLLISQMGMAGSTSTGDHVVIAGQAGIVGHVHIGDRSMVGAKAGVTKDVPPDQRMLGAPATDEREQKRILMTVEKLPEMRRQLRHVRRHLGIEEE